jgi:ubiquitin-protein ligase
VFIRHQQATNENLVLPPKVIKDLARELKNLDESPPEDIAVFVNEDNFSNITADIEGPHGTPYEGGVFRMKLILSHDFPQTPPKGYFVTRIFHPNIAKNGEICVNTLKKDWKPTLGLRHVLLVMSMHLDCVILHDSVTSVWLLHKPSFFFCEIPCPPCCVLQLYTDMEVDDLV